MANTLQIKRGAHSSLPTLNAAEFGFCTDTKQLFIGDGVSNHQIILDSMYTSTGDVLIATSSGVVSTLSVGTQGQLLQAGVSTPEWVDLTTGLTWTIISGSVNQAQSNYGYLIDALNNTVELRLPGYGTSTPTVGAQVAVTDYTNSATTTTSGIVITGLPYKIEGEAEPLVIDIDGAGFTLVWTGEDRGWEITTQVGFADVDAVLKNEYTDYSILTTASGTDPNPLTIPTNTLVGRLEDDITTLTPTDVRTLINVEDGAMDNTALIATTSGTLQGYIDALDYYTTSDVDTISGSLQSNIDNITASGVSTVDIHEYTDTTNVEDWLDELAYASHRAISYLGTGIIEGFTITINTDTTKIDISSGIGYIVDNSDPINPVFTEVAYPGITALALTYLTSNNVTYLAVNSSGVVIQQTSIFTPTQRRSLLIIGMAIHSNLTVINAINNLPDVALDTANQLNDFLDSLSNFNASGNIITYNGTNLNIDKSAGTIFKKGSNFFNSNLNPHLVITPGLTAPANIRYRLQDGTEYINTAVVDPDNYDLNGVLTGLLPNKWTIQRITLFTSNLIRIQYGQAYYGSKSEAIQALSTEEFVPESNLNLNGLLRGFLVVKCGASDLSDITEAQFLDAGKFGDTQVLGLSGAGTTTLQQAYENAEEPEITTNAVRGSVNICRGSNADTDDVLVIENGAGNPTFKVTGAGTISGTNVTSGVDPGHTHSIYATQTTIDDLTPLASGITQGQMAYWDGTEWGPISGSQLSWNYAGGYQELNEIQFDTSYTSSEHTEGRLYWDSDTGTFACPLQGGEVTLQVGFESLIKVYNNSGAEIPNGKLVYTTGSENNILTIGLADCSNPSKLHILGMTTETIAKDTVGYVAIRGRVSGTTLQPIDTSSFAAGTQLFLGTEGNFITDAPTNVSYGIIIFGHVSKVHASEGVIHMNNSSAFTLGDDYNGILRQSVINSSSGAGALASFTAVNNTNRRVSFSIVGSNHSSFTPNSAILYNEGYGPTAFITDGNQRFAWGADPTDSHSYQAADNEIMTLTASGSLGIGTTEPNSKLDVDGSFSLSIEITTTDYIVTENNYTVLMDGSNNSVNTYLPTASGISGRIYNIKCINDTYPCYIVSSGTENIDGSSNNVSIYNMESVTLQAYNSAWWII